MDFAWKVADLYDEMMQKEAFFRISTQHIFESCPIYKYIGSDNLFKGFFFMFVYKDLILRDLIQKMKDCLS